MSQTLVKLEVPSECGKYEETWHPQRGRQRLTSAVLINVYASENSRVQAPLSGTADILNVLLSQFNAEEAIIMILRIITTEADFHLLYDSGWSTL